MKKLLLLFAILFGNQLTGYSAICIKQKIDTILVPASTYLIKENNKNNDVAKKFGSLETIATIFGVLGIIAFIHADSEPPAFLFKEGELLGVFSFFLCIVFFIAAGIRKLFKTKRRIKK
jgi:hypothetical protein